MSKGKTSNGVPAKYQSWGQGLLLVALVSNSLVLLLNLYVSTLENKLSGKSEEERYFITNHQSIEAEIVKRTLLHTSLNQLKMLRRLTKDKLTQAENKMLLIDEKTLQLSIDASLRKITGAVYLQANEPPAGFSLDRYFSSLSDKQLSDMLPQLEDKSFKYARNLKREMIELMDAISYWKKVYSTLLVISTIILIVANSCLFAADRSNSKLSS